MGTNPKYIFFLNNMVYYMEKKGSEFMDINTENKFDISKINVLEILREQKKNEVKRKFVS